MRGEKERILKAQCPKDGRFLLVCFSTVRRLIHSQVTSCAFQERGSPPNDARTCRRVVLRGVIRPPPCLALFPDPGAQNSAVF